MKQKVKIIFILLTGGNLPQKFRMRHGEIEEQRVHKENRDKEKTSSGIETVKNPD